MLQAVIFDMDGVLVDTEPFICEAAMRMFAEKGVVVQPADFLPFVGAGEDRYIGGVAELHGVPLDLERDKARTYEIYGEIVAGRLEPLAGVHDFIGRARALGISLAVASSADRVKVNINLSEIRLPPDTFDAVICGQDVVHKKPDPEIFLTAAARLGADSARCLVVEDAVNGVVAARRAGMRCLGLTTSFTADDLRQADWTAATLAEAPEEVLRW